MSLLSLPSTWAAGPASCLADLNPYGQVSKIHGTATPFLTSMSPNPGSFPPDEGCPVGYSSACATSAESLVNGRQVSTVTCCPSIDTLSFMCNDDQHGCYATLTARDDQTGFTTDLGHRARSTGQAVTRTPVTTEEVIALAWGIRVVSLAPTSMVKVARSETTGTSPGEAASIPSQQAVSSITSPSTSTESTKEETGTSIATGTIIGISVGIVIPVALVSIGFFVLFRREQQRRERPRIFINNYISSRLSPTELLQLTSQGFHARDELPNRSSEPNRSATSASGDGYLARGGT